MAVYKGQEIMASLLKQEAVQLKSELQRIRDSFTHGGDRGDAAEATIREILRRHLPLSYRVGHGEVFNKDGKRSRQTDIVVANEGQPALFSDWDSANAFIIEGVAAAGEVKTSLQSASQLGDTFDKGAKFKSVLAEPPESSLMFSGPEDTRRFVYQRPYFAFFFESKLRLETVLTRLREWDLKTRAVLRPSIDGVFLLDQGSVLHFGDAGGNLKIRLPDGNVGRGYHAHGNACTALPDFLLWLFTSMQPIQFWQPPVVHYLVQEEDVGQLMLTDDGKLIRRALDQGSR